MLNERLQGAIGQPMFKDVLSKIIAALDQTNESIHGFIHKLQEADSSGTGVLTHEEFKTAVLEFGLDLSEEDVTLVGHACDAAEPELIGDLHTHACLHVCTWVCAHVHAHVCTVSTCMSKH